MEIGRRHLYKANYRYVLRLARFLKIQCENCFCIQCKNDLIEKIVRKL